MHTCGKVHPARGGDEDKALGQDLKHIWGAAGGQRGWRVRGRVGGHRPVRVCGGGIKREGPVGHSECRGVC